AVAVGAGVRDGAGGHTTCCAGATGRGWIGWIGGTGMTVGAGGRLGLGATLVGGRAGVLATCGVGGAVGGGAGGAVGCATGAVGGVSRSGKRSVQRALSVGMISRSEKATAGGRQIR